MNFIQKLTALFLFFSSAHNVVQAGILDNVQQMIPSMPETNKLIIYAGAAAVTTGAGISFNFYTDSYRRPRKKLINFVPWIPGIVYTTTKHPYATAGVAAALYGLYKHPEVLKEVQQTFNDQQLEEKIQRFETNHPDLTWLAKMYLFSAAYTTGVGINFAIWTNLTQNGKKDGKWRDVPAVGLFPYSYGLYLLARYK
jgi:hypothetical protein